MVIAVKDLETEQAELTIDYGLCSDWIESQSLNRFTFKQYLDRGTRQKCGAGMIADFYGMEWNELDYNIGLEVIFFVYEKTGYYFPAPIFDELYSESPTAARKFTVNWLRERGL